MKIKNVVLLIRNAAKTDFGGAETYQVSLASLLKKNGYKPIIVSRSPKLLKLAEYSSIHAIKGWWSPYQDWSGFRLILIPLYIIWQIILTLWYYVLIKKTSASILHVQSKDDFIAATIAGSLTKIKVIWSDHMDLRYIFENLSVPFRNPIGKLVFYSAYLADHIILISNNEYSTVTNHFKDKSSLSSKITVIKNGVIDDYSVYKKNILANNFTFCLASRIVTSKGIGEAIDAFELLQKMNVTKKALKMNIYGDGPEVDYFKHKVINNPSIIFHGHQSDVKSKIFESTVYILPSYQEGFSIALLEACMLEKTIIASDIDSNPEIITDRVNGLLVIPKDKNSLYVAMEELVLNDGLRKRLAVNARKNYLQNFNLDTIVSSQIIPLYKK